MKVLIAVLALVAFAYATRVSVERRIPLAYDHILRRLVNQLESGKTKRSTAEINEYVDTFLTQLRQYMVTHGFDPLKIPDIHESFEHKPLLITYHGELDLNNGWLQDVSTLYRNGDAIIHYEHLLLNLRIPISFRDLMFDFDYSAKLMNLGPTGQVNGKVDDVQFYVDVTVDLDRMELIVQELELEDAGKISIKFHGHLLVDWLADILTSVITTVLHNTVINVLNGKLNSGLDEITDKINAHIAQALA